MYDVVCVGAGLIGGVASALVKSSHHLPKATRVLLMDSAPRPSFKPTGVKNIRQIALNPTSRLILTDIGAWDSVEKYAWPVNKMTVWDAMGKGGLNFDGKGGPLSHIVEVGLVSQASVDAAENQGVEFQFETSISDIQIPDRFNPQIQDADFVKITAGEDTIESRLIMGCDGANSMVRTKSGLPTYSKEYNQRGFVCTVEIDPLDENKTAFQRFLPGGDVLAMLPCYENQMSIVWSCNSEKALKLGTLEPEILVEKINETFARKFECETSETIHNMLSPLGRAIGLETEFGQVHVPKVRSILSPTGSFPLATAASPNVVGPRVALLGDAAHRVHPFAGQGANMGYRDCELFMDAVEKAHLDGIDWTSSIPLSNYQSAARSEHGPMMAGLDTLKGLYGSSFMPLVVARNMGTNLINNNRAIKDMLISQAS